MFRRLSTVFISASALLGVSLYPGVAAPGVEPDLAVAATDSGRFTDDDESTFEADIEWLAQQGITLGCNPPANDHFCPDDPVTRGQMAAFLVRAFGLTDDGGGDLFVDDDGTTFEQDIDRLGTAGVTKGCNPPANDQYCPDDPVTRGQMAAFLVRAFGYEYDAFGDLFADDDGITFEGDIDRLGAAEVTLGCNPPLNDRYCPERNVTRGEMAAFLNRAFNASPRPEGHLVFQWLHEIYVMGADGSGMRPLTSDGGRRVWTDPEGHIGYTENAFPRWSPDGTEIAFAHYYGKDCPGEQCWSVRIIDADGSNMRTVVAQFPGRIDHVAWHPSGDLLLITGDALNQPRTIWSVTTDTGDIFVEYEAPLFGSWGASHAEWSPDGSTFAFSSGYVADYAWTVNLGPGSPIWIAACRGFARLSWAPDGSAIAYELGDSRYVETSFYDLARGTGIHRVPCDEYCWNPRWLANGLLAFVGGADMVDGVARSLYTFDRVNRNVVKALPLGPHGPFIVDWYAANR